MKIIDVQWRTYRLPFVHNFTTAHNVMTEREGIIVQITTEHGTSGFGEIAPLPTFAGGSLADAYAFLPMWAARLRNKTLHESLHLLTTEKAATKAASTLCGLEIALLDALGKTKGCSISTLLSPAGTVPRPTVPVNAVIAAETTQAAIQAAHDAKKNGFHCVKLKVGARFILARLPRPWHSRGEVHPRPFTPIGPMATFNKTPESPVGADLSCPPPIHPPSLDVPQSNRSPVGADLSCPPPIYRPSEQSPISPHQYVKPHHYAQAEIERIAAVRNALGPDIHLRLDANESWILEEATTILSQCIPYNIQYVEQPLQAHDLAGMRTLRQAIPIPIAADEALHSLESARLVLDSEAADILIIKPQLAGGLRAGQQIIQAAAERGVRCVITSNIESGIGLAAGLHLAAASPAVTFECGLATLHLLIDDLLIDDLPIRDGYMAVPTSPGLGVELDRQALDRYTIGGLD
jgi:L-alanine-DL-glutamate epimerase-like enolase superfamily enzyme